MNFLAGGGGGGFFFTDSNPFTVPVEADSDEAASRPRFVLLGVRGRYDVDEEAEGGLGLGLKFGLGDLPLDRSTGAPPRMAAVVKSVGLAHSGLREEAEVEEEGLGWRGCSGEGALTELDEGTRRVLAWGTLAGLGIRPVFARR